MKKVKLYYTCGFDALSDEPSSIRQSTAMVLASDYEALAQQLDMLQNKQNATAEIAENNAKCVAEGLSREAELREELRQMTVARDRWKFHYKNEQDAVGRLIDRCDNLTNRLGIGGIIWR